MLNTSLHMPITRHGEFIQNQVSSIQKNRKIPNTGYQIPIPGMESSSRNQYPDNQTDLLVTTPEGVHPFPSRTRKLSPPWPTVLGAQAPGRIGNRQHYIQKPSPHNRRRLLLLSTAREIDSRYNTGLFCGTKQTVLPYCNM